jgi:signal transduction histidine kinase
VSDRLAHPANLVRLAAGVLALAFGLGALAVARGPGESTTYAGQSDLAAACAVVAGIALVAAGVLASFVRPYSRICDLALLAGVVWFAPFWAGWSGGPPLAVSLGTLATGFAFALLVDLVLAYPTGRLRTKGVQALVLVVYLEATLFAVARALFRDPFFDPNCWDNCTDNVFLVRSVPGVAERTRDGDLWFTLAAAAALAIICVWRLVVASAAAVRVFWPVLCGGIVFGGATMAHSAMLLGSRLENPRDPAFLSIFAVACGAVFVIALGLMWGLLRALIQRRSVARIASELGDAPAPGSLESALAEAIGDPALRVAYWLPASGSYVDARGRPVEMPIAGPERTVTSLVRDGRRVALVDHAAAIGELERELGPAVRLAFENERLQAGVLAQLHNLRVSRTRIVETGDAERRRLERDLHDGAQQRLLALSYELRLAGAAAATDGDAETASLLEQASGETQIALGELRDLAHGIHPAILTEAGLGAALVSLAEGSPLVVEIGTVAGSRYPSSVEATAYQVVAEAIDDASRRGGSYVVVGVSRDGDGLIVTVDGDGARRTSQLINLADRVGAVGGTLDVGPSAVRAVIPCA